MTLNTHLRTQLNTLLRTQLNVSHDQVLGRWRGKNQLTKTTWEFVAVLHSVHVGSFHDQAVCMVEVRGSPAYCGSPAYRGNPACRNSPAYRGNPAVVLRTVHVGSFHDQAVC